MVPQSRLLSILFFLALTFSVGFTSPSETITNDASTYGKISINANRLFDTLLPSIRRFMLKHGLEPLQLEDISKHLPGIILHDRNLKLSGGWLQGLSGVRRSKDVVLSYEKKVVTLDAVVIVDSIDVDYEYLFKDALITRRGDMHATIKSMELRLVGILDTEHYKLSVPSVKVTRFGKLDIKLKGHVLDPILNAAIKAITPLFSTRITSTVEQTALRVMRKIANEMNEKIPQPDGRKSNDAFDYLPIPLAHRFA